MLLTPKETAELLRISVRTVRRGVAAGVFQGFRYGRQLRPPLTQFADSMDTAKVRATIVAQRNAQAPR